MVYTDDGKDAAAKSAAASAAALGPAAGTRDESDGEDVDIDNI